MAQRVHIPLPTRADSNRNRSLHACMASTQTGTVHELRVPLIQVIPNFQLAEFVKKSAKSGRWQQSRPEGRRRPPAKSGRVGCKLRHLQRPASRQQRRAQRAPQQTPPHQGDNSPNKRVSVALMDDAQPRRPPQVSVDADHWELLNDDGTAAVDQPRPWLPLPCLARPRFTPKFWP